MNESDEKLRLRTLYGYGLLDTSPEPEFDAIVRRAAEALAAPIALMSLVDADRQWFKAKVGIEELETPRSMSFCAYAIQDDCVMVVADARQDPRFRDNPLVTGDLAIRFYAGAPICASNGAKLGTICVIDREPRKGLADDHRALLTALSEEAAAFAEARACQSTGEAN